MGLTLKAIYTKITTCEYYPVVPELLEELVKFRPEHANPSDPVFPFRWPVLDTFKNDLKKAGISYRDAAGRQVDFHSLRVTLGTMLQRAGVPIRTAMEIMRHTGVRLIMNVYTDPSLLDTAGAVEKLPRLQPAPIQNRECAKTA